MQLSSTKALNKKINLVPKNIILFGKVKVVEKVVAVIVIVALLVLAVLAAVGYAQIGELNREIKEDQKIIAEGRLDELNALKEQYDNLILGIDSGNITLIPNIDITMTELFSTITKNKPESVQLIGVDGQLKSIGEYTYRMEYACPDRTVISGFLERLQEEKLEYINISTITKVVEDEIVRWVFAVTVQIGLYDKQDRQVALTEPINVPLQRSHHTSLKGSFLIPEASGGITIKPEFDGNHNIVID